MPRGSALKRNKLASRKSNTSTVQPPPKNSFFKSLVVKSPPPLRPQLPLITVSDDEDDNGDEGNTNGVINIKDEQPKRKPIPPVRIKLSLFSASLAENSSNKPNPEDASKSTPRKPRTRSSHTGLSVSSDGDNATKSQQSEHSEQSQPAGQAEQSKPRRSSRLASQEQKPTPMKLRISPPNEVLVGSTKRKSTASSKVKKKSASVSFFNVRRAPNSNGNTNANSSKRPVDNSGAVSIDVDHVSSSSLEELVLPPSVPKPKRPLPPAIEPSGNLSFAPSVVTTNLEPQNGQLCCTKCGTAASFEYKPRDSPVTPPIPNISIAVSRRRRANTEEKVDLCVATADSDPDFVDENSESSKRVTRSRLSVSRKRAERLAKQNAAKKGFSFNKKQPDKTVTSAVSIDEDVVDLCAESPKRAILWPPRDAASKRRKTSKVNYNDAVVNVDDIPDESVKPKPAAKLHSFFSMQQRNNANAGNHELTKQLGVSVPWSFLLATAHYNKTKRRSKGAKLPEVECKYHYGEGWTGLSHLTDPLPKVDSNIYNNCSIPIAPPNNRSEEGKTSLWSDVSQNNVELDRLNEAPIASLQQWLQLWYPSKERGETGSRSGYSSCDSVWTEDLDFDRPEDMEKIAMLTGPTGCGKSTVVKAVARRMGLSIVEINATTCRSSRKIKQIVMDALKIHRVTRGTGHFGNNNADPQSGQVRKRTARSLIVFEEVDMLHDDEKSGFWRMIREITSDDSCKRPMVFTANTITANMQAILGFVQPNDNREDVYSIVTPEPFEDQGANIIPFKHIKVEQKTAREIAIAVKTVSKKENLKLDKETVQRFTRLMHGKDIRYAINTLQLLATRSEGSCGMLPQFGRRARTCAEYIFGMAVNTPAENNSHTKALGVSREGEDGGLFDAMYLAVTELDDERRKGTRRGAGTESNLGAIADALEVYSEADTYSTLQGCFMEHSIADENDLVPDADILHKWDGNAAVAADLKAHALTSLGGKYAGVLSVGDVAVETGLKYEAANEDGARILEDYSPILGTRTAATEIVPMLRTMAVGSKIARAREQLQRQRGNNHNRHDGNNNNDLTRRKKNMNSNSNSNGMMEINYAEISFSRVGMGTRSKTRGNHMHLLGVGEDACRYLEHQHMTPQEDEVVEV